MGQGRIASGMVAGDTVARIGEKQIPGLCLGMTKKEAYFEIS
jgi:hypothetical protein